jgi:hypothetical protein
MENFARSSSPRLDPNSFLNRCCCTSFRHCSHDPVSLSQLAFLRVCLMRPDLPETPSRVPGVSTVSLSSAQGNSFCSGIGTSGGRYHDCAMALVEWSDTLFEPISAVSPDFRDCFDPKRRRGSWSGVELYRRHANRALRRRFAAHSPRVFPEQAKNWYSR